MEFRTCSQCNEEKTRIRTGIKKQNGVVFHDQNGKRWNGTLCPDCNRAIKREHTRHARKKMGRFDRPAPHEHKGIESERIVADIFRAQGYEVTISESHGPDLTLLKNGIKVTCEVKTASVNANAGASVRWYCSKVYPRRKNDDLIAIVFNRETVLIQPMSVHQAKCAPKGTRALTAEARELGVKYAA